jgi:ribosome-associated translation inhibitor RaiA
MMVPVIEIAFQHLDKNPWAEDVIRRRIGKLERIFSRLVSCRVHIDQPVKSSTRGSPPVVRIEMGIPDRRDLVVRLEPDDLQQKFQSPDLRNAINEAFRIAEDRLAKLKGTTQDHTRATQQSGENLMVGEITEVVRDGDHGFLLTNTGSLLYFHRNSVISGDFSALQPGTRVHYVEALGDTGPAAIKVRESGSP